MTAVESVRLQCDDTYVFTGNACQSTWSLPDLRTAAEVRASAAGVGWVVRDGGDFCPIHAEKITP